MLLIYLSKKNAEFFSIVFQADDKGRHDGILAAYCLFSFVVIAAIGRYAIAAITYH